MKNLLVNADFARWTATEATVEAVTGSTVAVTDGWSYAQAGTGTQPTVTIGRGDFYPGSMKDAGHPRRYLTVSPDSAGESLAAGSYSALVQNIDTPKHGAKQHAVLSFWARASVPWREVGVRVVQSYGDNADSADEVLATRVIDVGSAWDTAYFSTWQQYVIRLILPDYPTKSFGDAGTDSLKVEFYLQSGSTLFTPAIAWKGEVDFTSFQLEVGTSPTVFENRGVELEVVDVPETAASPGRPGQIAFNGTHIYVCPAEATWLRAAIETFS